MGLTGVFALDREKTDALQAVSLEMARQVDKFGEQNHANGVWLGILMEEVGEVGNGLLRQVGPFAFDTTTAPAVEEELVQVAAVALSWVMCLRRRRETLALLERAGRP